MLSRTDACIYNYNYVYFQILIYLFYSLKKSFFVFLRQSLNPPCMPSFDCRLVNIGYKIKIMTSLQKTFNIKYLNNLNFVKDMV
jgi:tRNA(His) 5'-end guanylyltransferase